MSYLTFILKDSARAFWSAFLETPRQMLSPWGASYSAAWARFRRNLPQKADSLAPKMARSEGQSKKDAFVVRLGDYLARDNGDVLGTGSIDGSVRFWNLGSGQSGIGKALANYPSFHLVDSLTELGNRSLLSEQMRAALLNSSGAVLVLDLDRFKAMNDKFGHFVGDQVLREIAQRLQNIIRAQDTAARIGGDEFALFIPDFGSQQEIERIVEQIRLEVSQPLTLTELGGARLTASFGVALAPEGVRDPEELMRQADRAMYAAKLAGGDRVVFASQLGKFDAWLREVVKGAGVDPSTIGTSTKERP